MLFLFEGKSMKVSINPTEFASRDYDDFLVVYNLRMKQIIKLENVAYDIWKFIETKIKTTLEEIVIHILSLYECEQFEVEQDVKDFLQDLFDSGFILFDSKYSEKTNIIYEPDFDFKDSDIEVSIIQELKSRNQLYTVTFEMTYACNEKCIHCYANYPSESNKNVKISIEKYKQLIDELYEMKVMHIAFTGGDPFMYKDFVEIFEYARKKQFICDIYTNAQILADNSEIFERIVKAKPRAVYISLYGADAETHEKITTVKGSFDKTVSVVKEFHNRKIPVVLNMMVLTVNHEKIEENILFAKELGVGYRLGLSIIYKNDGSSTPMNYFVSDKEKIKQILKIEKKHLFSNDIPIEQNNSDVADSICAAGSTTLSVSPDGSIYPCISLKIKLGNVFRDSFKKVWESEKRKNLVSSLVWKNTKECKSCKTRTSCPHCVGISELEKSDMFACNTCDKLLSDCLSTVSINQ